MGGSLCSELIPRAAPYPGLHGEKGGGKAVVAAPEELTGQNLREFGVYVSAGTGTSAAGSPGRAGAPVKEGENCNG